MGSFLRSKSCSNILLEGVDDISKVGETSIQNDFENLSVSQRLAANLSQKLKKKKKKMKKKKNKIGENFEDVESDPGMASFSGCLGLHVTGGGCKVGSCEDLDVNCTWRLSSTEECKPGKSLVENSISLPEKIWRRGSRKGKCSLPSSSAPILSLSDDILETILAMLPWTPLMAARRVCRKWRHLTGTKHFMQRRSEASYQKPCLFLFGVIRHGFNGGEVHALDISLDQWHRSSHDELKDRFFFSVASIGTDIYIAGGCCHSPYLSLRSSGKPLREVLVFNPMNGSFHEAAPMNEARSGPILGVFEFSSNCNLFHNLIKLHGQPQTKRRATGKSDVYEDPHRYSLRRQLRNAHGNTENSSQTERNSITYPVNRRKLRSGAALIAVGGRGSLHEPLDSAEIFDPITNIWAEIAPIPEALGPVCSGAVCDRMFFVYSEADKLAAFDLDNGCWMTIEASPPPLHLLDYHPKLVSCKSRLFLMCVSWCEPFGLLNRREKAARKMWEFDRRYRSWRGVSRHPDAPMDCNAFFFADQNKIYGVEMFQMFGQVLDFVTVCDVSGAEMRWDRVSRKHAAHEADASSCVTKSMLVMNL